MLRPAICLLLAALPLVLAADPASARDIYVNNQLGQRCLLPGNARPCPTRPGSRALPHHHAGLLRLLRPGRHARDRQHGRSPTSGMSSRFKAEGCTAAYATMTAVVIEGNGAVLDGRAARSAWMPGSTCQGRCVPLPAAAADAVSAALSRWRAGRAQRELSVSGSNPQLPDLEPLAVVPVRRPALFPHARG